MQTRAQADRVLQVPLELKPAAAHRTWEARGPHTGLSAPFPAQVDACWGPCITPQPALCLTPFARCPRAQWSGHLTPSQARDLAAEQWVDIRAGNPHHPGSDRPLSPTCPNDPAARVPSAGQPLGGVVLPVGVPHPICSAPSTPKWPKVTPSVLPCCPQHPRCPHPLVSLDLQAAPLLLFWGPHTLSHFCLAGDSGPSVPSFVPLPIHLGSLCFPPAPNRPACPEAVHLLVETPWTLAWLSPLAYLAPDLPVEGRGLRWPDTPACVQSSPGPQWHLALLAAWWVRARFPWPEL